MSNSSFHLIQVETTRPSYLQWRRLFAQGFVYWLLEDTLSEYRIGPSFVCTTLSVVDDSILGHSNDLGVELVVNWQPNLFGNTLGMY